MSTEEIVDRLEAGRRRGITGVWFGGGEPTLRPDLVPLILRARALGYRRVRIQSNGIRFAYPAFVQACLDAGATEFSISVKGVDARAHDALTRLPGSFERMTAGVQALAAAGAVVEADVLITTRSANRLVRIVERFADLGARAFLFRLFSRHGFAGGELRGLVPDLRAVAPHLEAAIDAAVARGTVAQSLHTPPCVLGEAYRSAYRHAGTWGVWVVPPGGPPFMAAESPMEGGAFGRGCAACALRKDCLGPRADYLAVRGDAAFVPVAPARRRGRAGAKR